MARQLGGRITSDRIKRLSNDAVDKMPLTTDVGLAIKTNIAVIATLAAGAAKKNVLLTTGRLMGVTVLGDLGGWMV